VGGGGTGDTEVFSSLVNVILAKIQDEYSTKDGEEYSFQVRQYGDEIEPEQKLFDRINGLYRDALREQLNKVDGDLSDQFVVNRGEVSDQ